MKSMRIPRQPVRSLRLEELARILGCPYKGDGETEIKGVSSLESAREGDLVFLSQPKHRALLDKTKASAAIIPPGEKYGGIGIPVIESETPQLTFIKVVELFFQPYRPQPGIHASAAVSASAKIGRNVSVGAMSTIGEDVEIGEGTVIFPLVSVYPRVKIGKNTIIHSHSSIREDVRVGSRVIIHNGAVIGSDGFGYVQAPDGNRVKVPQKGTVVIEDDVEIGANTAIDRASLGETVIRKGTKIDNLVQVAHNVEVGPNSILAGQTGIAGSSVIGKNAVLAGQVGVADHVKVGDNVIIVAQAGVGRDIPSGSVVGGSPHMDIKDFRKVHAVLPQLYDLLKELKKLIKKKETKGEKD